MRGKAADTSTNPFRQGITPAYAGKRIAPIIGNDIMLGSPPPMRGKVQVGDIALVPARITPAYAGKSFRTKSSVTSK